MKKLVLLLGLIATCSTMMYGQGARNIKINEVLTLNEASVQDEFGERKAWVELVNSSFTTFNVRGMFITTDRSVLNKNMSAPEREKRMCIIPNGEERTQLAGRQHLLFYANSNPNQGSLHMALKVKSGEPLWVALYDGNAETLIDSVTVPALASNESYARISDGASEWQVKSPDNVTPAIANKAQTNDKIARTKAEDPHGFAITILAMGTVFFCLALLFVFFKLLGILMDNLNTAKKIANTHPLKPVTKTVGAVAEATHVTGNLLQDGLSKKGIDKEVYIAVIAMALKEYSEDVHDVESGIITIPEHRTAWNSRTAQFARIVE